MEKSYLKFKRTCKPPTPPLSRDSMKIYDTHVRSAQYAAVKKRGGIITYYTLGLTATKTNPYRKRRRLVFRVADDVHILCGVITRAIRYDTRLGNSFKSSEPIWLSISISRTRRRVETITDYRVVAVGERLHDDDDRTQISSRE